MALLELLGREGELAEMLDMRETLDDLHARLRDERARASGKLTRSIVETLGKSADTVNPLKVEAREFNRAAEKYYRETSRRQNLEEAFAELRVEVAQNLALAESRTREVARHFLGARDALEFLDRTRGALLDDKLSTADLRRLLFIMLGVIADAEHQSKI